jgi:hypothetical protein
MTEQPLGVHDLWASADKAFCNASCGFISDAASYLRDAESSLKRLQRP